MDANKLKQYWKANIKFVILLLCAWFLFSYVCGIFLVESLNDIRIGGFKLGFWFAQQGSIYIFVALIFIYVYGMNKIDREYDVDEK